MTNNKLFHHFGLLYIIFRVFNVGKHISNVKNTINCPSSYIYDINYTIFQQNEKNTIVCLKIIKRHLIFLLQNAVNINQIIFF